MRLAREAVMGTLDRYSGYLDPKELGRVTEEFTGSYGGVGITVVGHELGLMIMSVREDGPAATVGLKTGDIIIKVDSTYVEGLNAYNASYLLRGPDGSPVDITVLRNINNIADTLQFKLNRRILRLIHVAYAGITPGKSLYIRLLDFEAGAAADVESALDSLYFKNSNQLKGIIFDLRGNPGGLLSEAVEISELFLNKGTLVVGMKGRSRWNNQAYYSTGNDVIEGLPMAILVDRGSASASEIMSGSLRYAGRASLIGDTTFGKGLVQEFDNLGDGSGLRLTTARYYFEGNIFLNDPKALVKDSAAGIPPDYYYKPIEYEPFPMELESSLLMREYAISRQDELASDSGAISMVPDLVEDFRQYLYRNGFNFESKLTKELKSCREEARTENVAGETFNIIEQMYALSRKDDSSQFEHYRDFIRQRLFQIALETKFGTADSYRRAIIPFRWEIALAEQVFKEGKQN